MKIVFITDAWLPIWGGGQEHVLQVSKILKAATSILRESVCILDFYTSSSKCIFWKSKEIGSVSVLWVEIISSWIRELVKNSIEFSIVYINSKFENGTFFAVFKYSVISCNNSRISYFKEFSGFWNFFPISHNEDNEISISDKTYKIWLEFA